MKRDRLGHLTARRGSRADDPDIYRSAARSAERVGANIILSLSPCRKR